MKAFCTNNLYGNWSENHVIRGNVCVNRMQNVCRGVHEYVISNKTNHSLDTVIFEHYIRAPGLCYFL